MAVAVVTKMTSEPEVYRVTWTLTSADPTGDAVSLPQARDRCWQSTGTWGGATMAAQGSNTNTDALFGAVTNANGGLAITETANSVCKNSLESCEFVRAKLTAVGAGATVVVVLNAAVAKRY